MIKLKSITTKLPLILTFCLLSTTNILPTTAVEICEINPKKANYQIANHDHKNRRDRNRRYDHQYEIDGEDGRTGRNGRDGQNQTITANGSPINLELSGTNGEDGEDGENAFRPRCRSKKRDNSRSTIRATKGGDGGKGGKGGKGGNGGSLTIYYSSIADLQKIFVRANSGEGGRGGRGGKGTRGCNCRRSRWEEKICQGTPGKPNYKCKKKVYRCYDGRDGRDGGDGSDGKRGSLGTLSIINSQEPLRNDRPKTTTTISQLSTQKINLSKNKWYIRQGATALLAPGSIITDQYREFDRRLEGSLQLNWQEKKPLSNFANQKVTLTLSDNEQIDINFPENLWVDGNAQLQNQLTTYTVNYAIPKQDVTKLKVAEFTGTGKNLNLKIVDLARRSDLINTKFKVKYRGRDSFDGFGYQTFYEGTMPDSLVTRNYNRFTLDLGKLQMSSKAIRSGTEVEIEVIAIRSLGERSTQQTLRLKSTIPRNR
ncbi:MAG: collagen-like protein [Sphaerospermopsis sp. SIO1G2]|nr:collagen-like protein [Sphaerospermopsis sp. SIO1G2]